MASETPVSLKKKRRTLKINDNRYCVIHFSQFKRRFEDIRCFTERSWESVKKAKDSRQQCEDIKIRLDDICDGVPNVLDDSKHGFHRTCFKNFTNFKYVKAEKRKVQDEKETENVFTPTKKRCTSSGHQ